MGIFEFRTHKRYKINYLLKNRRLPHACGILRMGTYGILRIKSKNRRCPEVKLPSRKPARLPVISTVRAHASRLLDTVPPATGDMHTVPYTEHSDRKSILATVRYTNFPCTATALRPGLRRAPVALRLQEPAIPKGRHPEGSSNRPNVSKARGCD